jgi:ribosomal protein L22
MSTEASPSPSPSAQLPSLRQESTAQRHNIRIGHFKLNEICRLVRGLNVDEAIIQMALSQKKKALYVKYAIQNARRAGIHNFQMDPKRMIVGTC